MAKAILKLNPPAGTVVQGGTFTITALDYTGSTNSDGITFTPVSADVTNPAGPVDTSAVGDIVLTYTLKAKGVTGDPDYVATKQTADYTLTVSAAPAVPADPVESFIDGSQDRFGNDTSGTTYETSVQGTQADPVIVADEVQSGYFDENGLDPYELANANKNK